MRVIECPNCYANVVLLETGVCPACNQPPGAVTADSNKTVITVSEGQHLPPLCFGCGKQTDFTIKLKKSTSSSTGNFFRIAFNLILIPLKFLTVGVWGLLMDTSSTKRPSQKITLNIPLCEDCQKAKTISVKWINFEEGTISFIVSRNVADTIKLWRE